MQDNTLLRISVICSVLGILVLFVMSSQEIVGEIEVGKLDDSYIDQNVKVVGKIQKISVYDKIAYLDVSQKNIVKVVLFKEIGDEFNFSDGENVEIIGKVDEYNGLQIIGNSVKKID